MRFLPCLPDYGVDIRPDERHKSFSKGLPDCVGSQAHTVSDDDDDDDDDDVSMMMMMTTVCACERCDFPCGCFSVVSVASMWLWCVLVLVLVLASGLPSLVCIMSSEL